MNTKSLLLFCFIGFVIIIMPVTIIQAQNDYQHQMDNIFNIPAHKVTTGVLINRSPEIIGMQNFKLQTKSGNTTAINVRNWMELFYRIYASHLNLNDFPYDITLANKYPSKTAYEQISLGLIYFRYNKIKDFAVQNRLLLVDTVNQKIKDISPAGQSPLEVDVCFAVSPLADTVSMGTREFILKDSLFVSNSKSEIREMYMNFDDGQGYVKVYPNLPFNVSYSTIGNKTLTAKIVVGSSVYYASSRLYVKEFSSILRVASDVPTPDFGAAQHNYNDIEAYYGIWYRCNHDNTIKKPILVVSGFDPSDIIRIAGEKPKDDDDAPPAYLYNIANKNGFLDRLRELGYDVIIYRSASSRESIISNAINLVNFMQHKIINVKTSDNELIVLGASMGGLVCRYALTYMEHYNIPHKTKLFISMDSPQNGANVPLGFQFMAYYLNNDLFGKIQKLEDAINNQLGSTAAKQMLIYHYEATTGTIAKCHPERTNYLNTLANIGNFPQQCTTMAISLGSGIGITQGFPSGATLIKKNQSPLTTPIVGGALDFLLHTLGIPFSAGAVLQNVTWEFEVNAVPAQFSKSIYKEKISLDVCIPKVEIVIVWTPLPVPVVVPYLDCNPELLERNVVVSNTVPLDNAPASIKNLHNMKDFDYAEVGQFLNLLGVTNIDQHPDGFIPSYSALGLNIAPHTNIKNYLNTQSNVQRLSPASANWHFYRNSNPAVSPFDYLYIENYNDDHIFDSNQEGVFSADLLESMDNMISSKNLFLENKTVHSGQSLAYEASETITAGYGVDNIPGNNGNFTVESGGHLDMKAGQIVLKSGFHVKVGSTVRITAGNSWICPAGSIQSVSLYPLSSIDVNEEEVTETKTETTEEVSDLTTVPKIENEVHFFPNPVEDMLHIHMFGETDEEIKITIVNSEGQTVYSCHTVNGMNDTIDCTPFSNGIYFVHVSFKNGTKTLKIIKK